MCNKTVFLLPSQDLLFDESIYPVSQEHMYDPAVLSQICSHTWVVSLHSLTSEMK